MSQTSYNSIELEKLKKMYLDAVNDLTEALFDGESWETIKEYRYELTDLEIAIHNKVRFSARSGKDRRRNSEVN